MLLSNKETYQHNSIFRIQMIKSIVVKYRRDFDGTIL